MLLRAVLIILDEETVVAASTLSGASRALFDF